jgi:hypothetical protein
MACNDRAVDFRRWTCVVAIGVFVLLASPAIAQQAKAPAPPKPPLTQADKARLKKLVEWEAEMRALREAGKIEEAIAAGKRILAVEREVLGDVHAKVATSLESLESL